MGAATAVAVAIGAAGLALAIGAGSSGTSNGAVKKPPEKDVGPQVSEETLRAQSTNMYQKPAGSWPGGQFAFALKESLTASAYAAMENFIVTSQTQNLDGTHVWELSPRTTASAPPNTQVVPMLNQWKAGGYAVLGSWDFPFPRAGKRHIVLVPPATNPFVQVDTSGEVVVFFSALYPPPSAVIQQGGFGNGKPKPSSSSLDGLPPELRAKVDDVLDHGTAWQMKQTAGLLQGAGHEEAAQFVLDAAQTRSLTRKTAAISAGAFSYKLRQDEQPAYYFAEIITGDGSRYKEMLPLNKGKLKQSPKGVDGWNAGAVIRYPVDWGDLDAQAPLPLAHGHAPPKKPTKVAVPEDDEDDDSPTGGGGLLGAIGDVLLDPFGSFPTTSTPARKSSVAADTTSAEQFFSPGEE